VPLKQPKKLDVMVAGDLFLDVILSGFSSWPEPGQESVAEEFCREIGGGAAITACGLAKLGSRTGVLGVLGADVGHWIVERLHKCSIDTTGIRYDIDEPTAITVAISSPADRAFFTYLGANRLFPHTLMEAATEHHLSHARHVHLACAPELDTAAEMLLALQQNDCSISLDVGWHEAWLSDPRAIRILSHLDLFFPNEQEAARMTGEDDWEKILRCFAQTGIHAVALKLGAQGAALLWNGQIMRAEEYPVDPVDTTGAGDCFDAGFLHAWLKGCDPETCLRAGTICGALSTQALGGLAAFPAPEELQAAMKGMPCAR
jgi:ribokinase